MSENENNLNLADVAAVSNTSTYSYTIRLSEFNEQCRIYYSTSSPLLCSGTINLVTTDGPKFAAHTNAKPEGGFFDTGKTWGSGWYAQWNATDSEGNVVIICGTPPTK